MKKPTPTSIFITFSVIVLVVGAFFFLRFDRAVSYLLSEKEEGDILFQSLPHGPLVDAIEGTTRSEWSHCGILVRKEGHWVVAESIGEVRYTPLFRWILRGRENNLAAYRLKNKIEIDHDDLIDEIDVYLGRPYDYRYAPEEDEIYCSELVYLVYKNRFDIEVGSWQKLGDLNYTDFEPFIKKMEGGNLPLERLMVTPVNLTFNENLRKVYPNKR